MTSAPSRIRQSRAEACEVLILRRYRKTQKKIVAGFFSSRSCWYRLRYATLVRTRTMRGGRLRGREAYSLAASAGSEMCTLRSTT